MCCYESSEISSLMLPGLEERPLFGIQKGWRCFFAPLAGLLFLSKSEAAQMQLSLHNIKEWTLEGTVSFHQWEIHPGKRKKAGKVHSAISPKQPSSLQGRLPWKKNNLEISDPFFLFCYFAHSFVQRRSQQNQQAG